MPLNDASAGTAPARLDPVDVAARYSALIFLVLLGAGLHRARAELPASAEPDERAAAGLDLRADRHRHDLRDPDRRHRPLGRLAGGADRARRGLRRQGRAREPLRGRAGGGRRQPGDPRLPRRGRRRHGRGGAAGLGDHPAEGAALRRHARRADRLARRGAALLGRRADLGVRARATPGGARAGSRACRCRSIIFILAAVVAHVVLRHTRVRPARLRRRRQRRGGDAERRAHPAGRPARLRHRRLLLRARLVPARRRGSTPPRRSPGSGSSST